MPTTIADRILAFNNALSLDGVKLPEGIRAMNPFKEEHAAMIADLTSQFYRKYYSDNRKRKFIIGINPGRHGAGLTGVPFTDTKRLESECGIPVPGVHSHEPSSVFVYEVIKAYGGPEAFYRDFYINSVSPLGYVINNEKGREVNYNYYDSKALEEAVKPFILQTLKDQIAKGLETEKVWCLGSGKNFKFLKRFNDEHQLFGEVIPLDHPRYVVQYRNKRMPEYVEKFISLLGA